MLISILTDIPQDIPTTHRILDPALGGGALLDLYVAFPHPVACVTDDLVNLTQRPLSSGLGMSSLPMTAIK